MAAVMGITILDRPCWLQQLQLTSFAAEPNHRCAGR
jgi:hypothetical protein